MGYYCRVDTNLTKGDGLSYLQVSNNIESRRSGYSSCTNLIKAQNDSSEERNKFNLKVKNARNLNALGFAVPFSKGKNSKIKIKLKDDRKAERELIFQRFAKTREKYLQYLKWMRLLKYGLLKQAYSALFAFQIEKRIRNKQFAFVILLDNK